MSNDWRTKPLFVLFMIIPCLGAWEYAKVYQTKTDPQQVSLAELVGSPLVDSTQCLLNEFEIRDTPVDSWRYEYVLAQCALDDCALDQKPDQYETTVVEVDSCDFLNPGLTNGFVPTVVLRRERSLEGTLADQFKDGSVEVAYSPGRYMGWEEADRIGLPVGEFGPGSYWMVDVDRDDVEQTLSSILWVTFGLSVCGFGLLFYILCKIHVCAFLGTLPGEYAEAQVALNIAITRQAAPIR